MLGVVLWSDRSESKAVVWCEDHGDLAYISMCPHSAVDPSCFDAGDLIQFDLALRDNLRMAHNPRLIAQYHCADIDNVVKAASQVGLEKRATARRAEGSPQVQVAVAEAASADVIDFQQAAVALRGC